MKNRQMMTLDKIACLQVLGKTFGQQQQNSNQYNIQNVPNFRNVNNISIMLGVTTYNNQWKLAKSIYRVSRGYATIKFNHQFQFYALNSIHQKDGNWSGKSVAIIIYPTSDSKVLNNKIKRVMQAFCQKVFDISQLQTNYNYSHKQQLNQFNQISNLIQISQKQQKSLKININRQKIQQWKIYFYKQKQLYIQLNKLDRRQKFYIGRAYIPKQNLACLFSNLYKINPPPSVHQIQCQKPPTAFQKNSYLAPACQITDTYGTPRYKQMTPSVFTVVTFPFFFGVMFGDIAHGLIMFCLGIWFLINHKNLKGILKKIAQLRFMITMMGFFAVYCGFIYNDLAGYNFNFFGSCYNPPHHPGSKDQKIQIHMQPINQDCIYPFGIDPIWGRSQNQLAFVNSLKMKLSVIIAIIHMTLGVCIKAINSIYFKKRKDFWFQFVPQVIFLALLFGYMDFLIIFKWLKNWKQQQTFDNISPLQWAPSIISTMMNLGLSLGKTVIFYFNLDKST